MTKSIFLGLTQEIQLMILYSYLNQNVMLEMLA